MFASRPSQSVLSGGHFALVGDGGEHDPESVEMHFGYEISGALKELNRNCPPRFRSHCSTLRTGEEGEPVVASSC